MGEVRFRATERALWIPLRSRPRHSTGDRGTVGGCSGRLGRHHVWPQGFTMISVEEAVERITRAFVPLPSERVALEHAAGRVLAANVSARLDHPPAPMSAMDGYAVRASEAALGATLAVIGEAPAGRP